MDRTLSVDSDRGHTLRRAPAPSHIVDELKHIAQLAGPMTVTLLCRFLQGFVDLAVVGHFLSTDALTAVSLALTIQFFTLGLITFGIGDTVPTLCAQAFGAGNLKLMGLWLQVRCAVPPRARHWLCVPVRLAPPRSWESLPARWPRCPRWRCGGTRSRSCPRLASMPPSPRKRASSRGGPFPVCGRTACTTASKCSSPRSAS